MNRYLSLSLLLAAAVLVFGGCSDGPTLQQDIVDDVADVMSDVIIDIFGLS